MFFAKFFVIFLFLPIKCLLGKSYPGGLAQGIELRAQGECSLFVVSNLCEFLAKWRPDSYRAGVVASR